MKKMLAITGAVVALTAVASAQPNFGLIISEVVDGTRSGALPRYTELTNCSATPVDLSRYSIANVNNANATPGFPSIGLWDPNDPLAPIILNPGESYVINWESGTDGPGNSVFFDTYGFDPDNFNPGGNFFNGNDGFVLFYHAGTGVPVENPAGTFTETVVDVYGELNQNGLGEPWEFEDSFAFRLPQADPTVYEITAFDPNDVTTYFDINQWYVAPIETLVGLSAEELARATTPGYHGCTGDTGACCVGEFCVEVTDGVTSAAENCVESQGGFFFGYGTDCVGVDCALSTGACCLYDGMGGYDCFELTRDDCIADDLSFGAWAGAGTSCTEVTCELTCADIATVKAGGLGQRVRLCDVTLHTTTDLISSSNSQSFYAQDATGGMSFFGPNQDVALALSGVTPIVPGDFEAPGAPGSLSTQGDVIDIDGWTGEFASLFQMTSVDEQELVLVNNDGPAPIVITDITMTDLQDGSATGEFLESQLVRLSCVQFVDGGGTFNNATNYVVQDANGNTAEMRIASPAVTLVGTTIPTDPVSIVGYFGQFDFAPNSTNGYQIIPRAIEDIVVNPVGCDFTVTGACCTGLICVPDVTQDDCELNLGGVYQGDLTECNSFTCLPPSGGGACLIISEVVDATLSGGNPKFVEITNTGTTDYTFPAGGIIVQSNASSDTTVDVDLTGVTILAGQSYVVQSSANGGQGVFESTYGFPADLYTSAFFSNGDDRYIITDGTSLIDIHGEFGVDGSGSGWEYIDSYAFRNPAAVNGNNGVFDISEWTHAGPNALDGLTALDIASLTTPGTHTFNPGCVEGGPTGACCLGEVCVGPVSETTCVNEGGAYLGNDTTCDFNPCATVTGACCNGSTCTDETEADCVAGGGFYQGDGTACSEGFCTAPAGSECLIISEVVDATLPGGNPKFVEITNTGTTDYTFTNGGVIVQSNASTDLDIDVDLTGVTILAGQSFVIQSSANGGETAFFDTYGFDADLYTPAFFSNGDDRYIITDAGVLLDIHGEIDTDGTGSGWEYLDSYAFRNSNVNQGNGGVFDITEWTHAGVDALDGADEAGIAAVTTPGTHAYDNDCGVVTPPCPEDIAPMGGDGVVDSADLNILLSNFGTPCVNPPDCGGADFTGDGNVDSGDLNILLTAFGPCPE